MLGMNAMRHLVVVACALCLAACPRTEAVAASESAVVVHGVEAAAPAAGDAAAAAPQKKPAAGGPTTGTPPPRPGMEACVDRWLASKDLNAYGDPKDTMYAGGTPLFDERSGKTRDRVEYVFSKHPEAKAKCAKLR